MFDTPKTIEEAKKYRYNKWAGNPDGWSYRENYCAYEVSDNFTYHQCCNRKGKGINGLYCHIHAKGELKK